MTVIQNHVLISWFLQSCMQNQPPAAIKKIVFIVAIGLATTTFGESSCKVLNEKLLCQEITGANKPEDFLDVKNVN